uniref:Uncharacterized protein n=1 Tax=mine drainage metagenome TaxID=410659 RepID=E6QQ20_9ZZZZ
MIIKTLKKLIKIRLPLDATHINCTSYLVKGSINNADMVLNENLLGAQWSTLKHYWAVTSINLDMGELLLHAVCPLEVS